jgi:DNA-directed RNA polymerase specialized sigma24 family protein
MDDRLTPQQSDFESLLTWLSENREVAGEIYEKIRIGLIRYFYYKGCKDSEALADETIDRVIKKLPTLDLLNVTKPISIFYGFATNVALEQLRKDRFEVSLEGDHREILQESNEKTLSCLDECLRKLPEIDEKLLRDYYAKEKSEKVLHRQNLAREAGLNIGTLQTKLHRLRISIRTCIESCLKDKNL